MKLKNRQYAPLSNEIKEDRIIHYCPNTIHNSPQPLVATSKGWICKKCNYIEWYAK